VVVFAVTAADKKEICLGTALLPGWRGGIIPGDLKDDDGSDLGFAVVSRLSGPTPSRFSSHGAAAMPDQLLVLGQVVEGAGPIRFDVMELRPTPHLGHDLHLKFINLEHALDLLPGGE
jgi:hypothetical protein